MYIYKYKYIKFNVHSYKVELVIEIVMRVFYSIHYASVFEEGEGECFDHLFGQAA